MTRRRAITAGAAAVLLGPTLARARASSPTGLAPWSEAGLVLGRRGEFTLADLPYAYTALEPFIDAETMEIHHSRHHKAYVDNANKALAGTEFTGMTSERIIAMLDDVPSEKRAAVRNNLGGHINHSMFWLMMAPPEKGGGGEPDGALADAITRAFGSFGGPGGFKERFAQAAASRFGSGWAWLVSEGGALTICSTANQDSPYMTPAYSGGCSGTPILGLDVWEHAYYLKYRNRRADYVGAFWNVVNWATVARLHTATIDPAEIGK
ncbi:MAG: superoxide dismutase [Phycisphaeraceae bacterium]|nr:superoxide dismutase [Phycisphaerae bacterium]MBX3391320.1 superoxide dismutase [Phycisphaeraceae bacterium]